MNININQRLKYNRNNTLTLNATGNDSVGIPDDFVRKWEDWNSDLNVSGKTYSENFIFSGLDDESSSGGTSTSIVTGLNFSGTTLTLTQTGLSDLVTTLTLASNHIPELPISKITGLQDALDNAGTEYIHPTYTPINLTLTGATVVNTFTTNTIGSVTGFTTRTLTPTNIGAEPAFSKGSFSIGTGLNTTGTLTNRLYGTGNISISLDTTYLSNNYVTLNTDQTITGLKTFTQNVIGPNFIFDSTVGGGGGGTSGTTVTGISFSGRTLTLTQIGVSNLTATFSLIDNDIPSLPISKIINLQTTLDSKANTSQLHNPVTIGTANGLSLTNQQLSLSLVTTSTNGAMSATDKSKLDGVAPNANNYVHPSYTSRNITATGASVLSTFTSDGTGHVTGITTRTLTIGDLSGVPTTRTLTINGTTQDLSANRTWNINLQSVTNIGNTTTTAIGLNTTDLKSRLTVVNTGIWHSISAGQDDTHHIMLGASTDYAEIQGIAHNITFNKNLVLQRQGGEVIIGGTSSAPLAGVKGLVVTAASNLSVGISLANGTTVGTYWLMYRNQADNTLRWFNGSDRMNLNSSGVLTATNFVFG